MMFRVCYVSRPSVATERLALNLSGQVRYQLMTAYRVQPPATPRHVAMH
jgi:hypothetical protein